MVYSEKLLNIIALMKCEDHHTKKLILVLPYNCLYLNKGNNSSVKGSILTKLVGYKEFMILIICTKNELNLTNRYWDMVPDRQKVQTDGMDRRTDAAKTISLRLRRGIKIKVVYLLNYLYASCYKIAYMSTANYLRLQNLVRNSEIWISII